MARHLRKADVEVIVNIIRGWSTEKLTWGLLCSATANALGKSPTRQTLNAHGAIRDAFAAKKTSLKLHGPSLAMPGSLAVAARRIARLQAENDELRAKNDALLEQFVVWQYNAYKHGLKQHQLDEFLPRIDRERTDFSN